MINRLAPGPHVPFPDRRRGKLSAADDLAGDEWEDENLASQTGLQAEENVRMKSEVTRYVPQELSQEPHGGFEVEQDEGSRLEGHGANASPSPSKPSARAAGAKRPSPTPKASGAKRSRNDPTGGASISRSHGNQPLRKQRRPSGVAAHSAALEYQADLHEAIKRSLQDQRRERRQIARSKE